MAYDSELAYPLELQQEIGRGGLGEVYLAYHHRLKKHVVVKKVASGRMRESDLRIEVDLLKNLHHSYLPQVYDFIQTKEGTYTIMEYVDGVSLAQYIIEGVRPPQEHLHTWLLQFCSVLEYLHNHVPPIIHSDIKPENVLITKRGAIGGCGNICLIDFNITPTATSSQIVGLSIFYASPEQRYLAQTLRGISDPCLGSLAYNILALAPTSDIYSLGATFHDLIVGSVQQVPTLPLPDLADMDLPYQEAFLRVIDKATRLDPAERYQNATALRKALLKRERNDTAYRHNRRLQWLVAAAASLVLLSGVTCLASGAVGMRNQDYVDAYAHFTASVAGGDATVVVRDGMALLNNGDYASYLDMNPQDKANVLHALSDALVLQGDLNTATTRMSEALQLAKGGSEQAVYYRDYAILLAQAGRFDEARAVLNEASGAGVDSDQCRLVEAQINYLTGDIIKALQQAQAVINTAYTPELVARAHLLCADIYNKQDNWEKQIAALESANQAYPTPDALRRLAEAFLVRAQSSAGTSKTELFAQACKYLAQLCAQPAPGIADRLNYSTALRATGDTAASLAILNALNAEIPGDYRVLTQLALLEEQNGNLQQALGYCTQVLNQLGTSSSTSEGKNAAQANTCREAMQSLKGRLEKRGVS
jgi:tetratricopeptide (TPR) repeat protein/tRNA A-37 threonylcarbamoyl transferase component Bud32